MIKSLMPEPLNLGLKEDEIKTPEDSIIIVCGPERLKESIRQILDGMGWENAFYFN